VFNYTGYVVENSSGFNTHEHTRMWKEMVSSVCRYYPGYQWQ